MSKEENKLDVLSETVLEELLDGFCERDVPRLPRSEREAEVATREYTEVFGLLGYADEPVDPPASVKTRLMGLVTDEGVEPGAEEALGRFDGVPVSRRSTWSLPLAAAIAMAFLGVSGWQFERLREQRVTIETLSEQLSMKNVEIAQVAGDSKQELERMQDQLALVTSQGVEVCKLRPQVAEAAATGARGALFVASDHQRWYLRIDDLEPCPQGRTYQLWFVRSDGTTVDGGTLDVRHGVELEITSDTMPDGTIAVHVTLEPAGGSQEPSGPTVLYGDEVMRIL